MIEPELPYAGSSGWSGTDTSRERAERMDSTGKTAKNQELVLALLELQDFRGVTWKDLSSWYDWHHGTASGVLSALHKADKIVRLLDRRDRCRIYVLPEYVRGRQYDLPKRNMPNKEVFDMLIELHEYGEKFDDLVLVGYCEVKLDKYWPNWRDK